MSRRGGKKSHKGGRKVYTNPEEIDAQMRAEEERKKWRETHQDDSDEEELAQPNRDMPPSDSEESSDEELESGKAKGISHLIEVENPNRVVNKAKKAKDLDVENAAPVQLSRKEREEIEKQRAKERYMALHKEGKTEEAKSDLARLAIIRKNREDAAKKKAAEKEAKEAAAAGNKGRRK